jgi:hypothetical protein
VGANWKAARTSTDILFCCADRNEGGHVLIQQFADDFHVYGRSVWSRLPISGWIHKISFITIADTFERDDFPALNSPWSML